MVSAVWAQICKADGFNDCPGRPNNAHSPNPCPKLESVHLSIHVIRGSYGRGKIIVNHAQTLLHSKDLGSKGK